MVTHCLDCLTSFQGSGFISNKKKNDIVWYGIVWYIAMPNATPMLVWVWVWHDAKSVTQNRLREIGHEKQKL